MTADFRDIWQMQFLSTSPNGTQTMENNSMGMPIYIGYADAGSLKGANRWQIRKVTYDSNNFITDIQFADGSAEFKFEWDERATYTYS